MPVDKFGHTTIDVKQNVVASGVSITQANNVFLKRDGTNHMVADLNMNLNSIKGLPDTVTQDDEAVSLAQVTSILSYAVRGNIEAIPTNDNHITNKKYVDDLIKRNILMTATPIMTSNETVINGLTYVVSVGGGTGQTDDSAYKAFQNEISDGWMSTPLENIWIQMKYPFPLSMSGFHILVADPGLVDSDIMISRWKVQASNDGITFTDIVSFPHPFAPSFTTGDLIKYIFQTPVNYVYWRFHIVSSNSNSGKTGIEMLQWIPTLPDKLLKKCHVGYVPRLTSNANYCGFEVSASSEVPGKKAYNAFKGDNSAAWVASEITPNCWLQIQCPIPVRIWKIGLKGRVNENIVNWRIEAKRDLGSWVVLWRAQDLPNKVITERYKEFDVDSVCKFDTFRLVCLRTEFRNLVLGPNRVGINTMQLFVYDD